MEWFVQLHKKICDWEWYTDIPTKTLFLHVLLKCNYKEAKWKGKIVKPWEFITSIEHLSLETWLSRQQVRTAIQKLKSTWEITHYSTNEYTTLALNNWESYNTPDNKRITNEQQTNNKRITTTNKNNKDYKEKKEKEVWDTESSITVLQEHINTLPEWTTRHTFYSSILKNIELVKYTIDTKAIEAIENKLTEFRVKLWDERTKLELESFWEHHSAEKTDIKSIILRLNTWMGYSLKK